jgi:hypothetical protein
LSRCATILEIIITFQHHLSIPNVPDLLPVAGKDPGSPQYYRCWYRLCALSGPGGMLPTGRSKEMRVKRGNNAGGGESFRPQFDLPASGMLNKSAGSK